MNPETMRMLAEALTCLADDELILGHRNSEWCGHAPILEEDIAFANISLDEIGHAELWYRIIAGLAGEDPDSYPDQLVYFRPAGEFRNLPLVEFPRGDWAFSMLRQYLFDAAELVRLEALGSTLYKPLGEVARKIYKEELYHYRHSRAWVERLAQGTQESHERMQTALNAQWPYAADLFTPLPGEHFLAAENYLPDSVALGHTWKEMALSFCVQSGLVIPEPQKVEFNRSRHTPYFDPLLMELQSVARLEPGAAW
jgi:ring-1,2-phenylacetyl-CoA epoxidase subunit PaaC